MDIAGASEKLSRNPLGIIALFIVLVYGIAALVFGLQADTLEPSLKAPLIYFLVGFPVLVLLVFTWLVSNHHTKLYSPADFRADESFLRTIDLREQNLRLDAEIDAVVPDESIETIEGGSKIVPEKVMLARRSDIRESIILAEDLVFRDLELEFSAPIRRHVELRTGTGETQLDGAILQRSKVVGVEVKFFRRSFGRKSREYLLELARRVEGMSLIFALVSEGVSEEEQKQNAQRLRSELAGISHNVEIRTYSFESLRIRFGIDRVA